MTAQLEPDMRETIARAIHEQYRTHQVARKAPDDPAMAEWDGLSESLKESNRNQAQHIFEKLERIGCSVHDACRFSDEEIELLAEMEHERWNQERRRSGWTLGPRDNEKKTSPYLASWSELPDDVREYDREAVRAIPTLLATVGLEIRRRE